MPTDTLETVRRRLTPLWEEHGLLQAPLTIRARPLRTDEAIGDPEGLDYPLLKGRERLMEAEFRGFKGQAYTDRFGDFQGSLGEIASMALTNNFRRAVFVAAANATLRCLGLCGPTVHCRDAEPAACAARFADALEKRHGARRVALIGYQPAFIQAFAPRFELRVVDLDPDNIGRVRHGVPVAGPDQARAAQDWADVVAVTGSTLANGSIGDFFGRGPVVFYGTTVAGAAALMGWERFCAMAC